MKQQVTPAYLFVYGTLSNSFTNEFALLLKKHSKLVGSGFFNGSLYDLGEYPGAKVRPNTSERVLGQVFEIKNPRKILPKLDHYEGIGESFSAPYEYKRDLVPIQMEDGTVRECWVYLYNWKATGRKKVHSGNYADYVVAQK